MNESPFKEGELLAGKYKVERMIAKGGMGVVVAAMHEALDQRVALKFLLPEGASDTDAIGRFLREARAAVRLRSEHVAKVLDVGTLDTGSPYIVMEYLEGRDLQAVLTERGRLPAHTAVSYVLQACEAIAEAHAHGIVHRDLKPGNLFLTRRNDGTPCIKVLDFGISKHSGSLGGMTKTSALMGTPYYVSPEQLRSSKNVDARSDIWALGMILYELLTGSVAFPRDTLPELCTAIIYEPVPDFRSHGVEVAPQLVAVVLKCLAKLPEERFQTLAELASSLSMFVADGDASAERISRILDPQARSPSIQPAPDPAATLAPAHLKPPPGDATVATRSGAWLDESQAAPHSAAPDNARTMQSVSPAPKRPGVRLAAGVLGAAAVVVAALWLIESLSSASVPASAVATTPSVAPEAPHLAAAEPTGTATATAVVAASPAAPPELVPAPLPLVSEPKTAASVPAPNVHGSPARTTTAARPAAALPAARPTARPSEGDDFGDRK